MSLVSEEYDSGEEQTYSFKKKVVEIAPKVDIETYDTVQLGPSHPRKKTTLTDAQHLGGNIESWTINDYNFNKQMKTFDVMGYAVDPSTAQILGDKQKYKELNGADIYDKVSRKKPKREERGDPADPVNYKGPWAAFEGDSLGKISAPTQEEVAASTIATAKTEVVDREQVEPGKERTLFHGIELHDYLGRTYWNVPNDIDVDLSGEGMLDVSYLPKKLLHTWTDHSKALSRVRLLPNSGHILLSASMDAKMKIFDVYHDRKCLRTIWGHNMGVRDIEFNSDGKKFLSAGYDKFVKLWDTETGQCIQHISLPGIPYCIKFHPDPNMEHIFFAGCSDNRVRQWDMKSGVLEREYSQHLDSVNSITFLENDKFFTTSDDKTMRVWEIGKSLSVKYIAEPLMLASPSAVLHPNHKNILVQSYDNSVLTFNASDKFKKHQKRFKGHILGGFGCQIATSPDGKFLMSGDSTGNMWFWDYESSRIARKMKAHDKVVIDCAWHPKEPSKIVTASWDSTIKLWR